MLYYIIDLNYKVWDILMMETPLNSTIQIDAEKAAERMAFRYNVTEEDFQTIEHSIDGTQIVVVAFAGRVGIDLGNPLKDDDPLRSWDSIMSDEADHFIDLNGQIRDTRAGMTRATYHALVGKMSNTQGINIDSPQNNEWSITWLTGDKTSRQFAPIGRVDGANSPYSSWNHKINPSKPRYFRPSVVL
jgi:hypothetical protein